ncbi:imidazole glycerol phosphate synthase hisHF, chloroplastic-like isoform X2 [Amaranthus tricolor]|uniref:imidazole glycerol phosphate synthase hisHF, chloroplastic-like isoform X2 n=1 Tax=Amaranthus tricolor TaxID=29722 RepID=UPI0025871413|nr:imidazole glycerol phosphate synthase hisHF, chloroplastic-like isoform X2 [Amaranthus tricolor]
MEAQAATASLSSSFSVNTGIIPYYFCHLRSMKNTNARIKSPIPFSVRAAAVNSKDNVVTLLDYGAGNVRSLRNAIRLLGFEINDVQEPDDILKANRLIFPGVGAFATAMNVLNERGSRKRI